MLSDYILAVKEALYIRVKTDRDLGFREELKNIVLYHLDVFFEKTKWLSRNKLTFCELYFILACHRNLNSYFVFSHVFIH